MADQPFLASNSFDGDGTTTDWEFSWEGLSPDSAPGAVPYIATEDIHCEEMIPDGEDQIVVQKEFTLLTPTKVRVLPATPVGTILRVYRVTENRFPLVDYNELQVVSEADLDLANRQAVYIVQEARDAARGAGNIQAEAIAIAQGAAVAAAESAAEAAASAAAAEATVEAIIPRLANDAAVLDGAGMLGFDEHLAYASDTIGGYLHERKTGVSVVEFGADPTGAVDSTTQIQEAIAAATALNTFVYGDGVFRLSAKVVITCACDFSQADFLFYGQPAISLEFSSGSAANPTDFLMGLTFIGPRLVHNVDKPTTGWAGSGIGVRTVNLNQCRVSIGTIRGFGEGMRNTSFGASSGHAYCVFEVLTYDNNRVNLNLEPGDTLGWVNENLYIAGRYRHNTAEGTNIAGVRHLKLAKATNSVNNNYFLKPSLEGNTPQYHVENGGSYNTIAQGRWEASPAKVLYTGDTAQQGTDNIIIGGYQASEIVFTYTLTGAANGNYNRVIATRETLETTGSGHVYMNAAGDEQPVWRIQQAAQRPEDATLTNYAVRQTAQTHRGKLGADTFDRVVINYSTPRITFGGGSATQDVGVIRSGVNTLQLLSGAAVIPSADNAVTCGAASFRWSVVYAGTGTINTSDGRYKQQIRPLLSQEKAVALRLKGLIRAYKFNDAVAAKGNGARIHVGVIAQDVKAAFEAEGLVAEDYAVLCYDEWGAQPAQLNDDGSVLAPAVEAGNRYGVRYDELLAFIITAL